MASKKFKGETCPYCGGEGVSETVDHVLAREFFLEKRRANLPKVPACTPCNAAKSRLETYLTGVLPFGGRHQDALVNLETMVPKRLAGNSALGRELRSGIAPVWVRGPSGLIQRTSMITIDAVKLHEWCRMVIRGFAFHHWKLVFEPQTFIDLNALSVHGEPDIDNLLALRGAERVRLSLGEGTFAYDALRSADNPQIAVWRMELYGGVQLGGADPRNRSRCFGAMTGPHDAFEQADLVARWRRGAGAV